MFVFYSKSMKITWKTLVKWRNNLFYYDVTFVFFAFFFISALFSQTLFLPRFIYIYRNDHNFSILKRRQENYFTFGDRSIFIFLKFWDSIRKLFWKFNLLVFYAYEFGKCSKIIINDPDPTQLVKVFEFTYKLLN